MRLFVAIELPPAVLDALGRAQDALRKEARSLRFVRPEGIHLTLKFIGDVAESDLARIEDALGDALPTLSPFTLSTAGPGTFGGSGVRVVWIGVDGDLDPLRRLQARIDRALAELGVADADDRPFRAHLTLARVRDGASPDERRRVGALVRSLPIDSVAFDVSTVVLMRSRLGRDGARYTALARFPRAGRAE